MSGVWIRSQDGCGIVFAHRIMVIKRSNETTAKLVSYNLYTNEAEDYAALGTYATEARALEVLDGIQRHATEQYRMEWPVVYQMPKE